MQKWCAAGLSYTLWHHVYRCHSFGRTEQWCLYRRTLNVELLFGPWEAKLHF